MNELIDKWLRKFNTYVILITDGDIAAAEELYKLSKGKTSSEKEE